MFTDVEASECRLLAPFSVSFVSTKPAVVRTANDNDLTIADMEMIHLRAIRDADFVLLHVPDGHVGTSTAFEIGYASALRKPLFAFQQPRDEMLSTQVMVVRSTYEAIRLWRQIIPSRSPNWASPNFASAVR